MKRTQTEIEAEFSKNLPQVFNKKQPLIIHQEAIERVQKTRPDLTATINELIQEGTIIICDAQD